MIKYISYNLILKASMSFLEKQKNRRSARPDVLSYLTNKKETDNAFKMEELQYKRDALEAETKFRQQSMEMEKKRIELQEEQMRIQMELIRALVTKK